MNVFISCVLCAALVLGTVVPAAASGNDFEYWDVLPVDECSDAVNALSRIGVISGFADGSYRPTEQVTRAQFAKLMSDALSLRGNKNIDMFSDVPSDHWAAMCIADGVLNGYICGYEDGTFRPDEGVTYLQAVKMLVTGTGYAYYAEQQGGWPDGYKLYGETLGISLSGISYDAKLNRAQAAQLIWRAMNVPLVLYDKIICFVSEEDFDPTMQWDIFDGVGRQWQTLLTELHSVYIAEGYIDGDSMVITYSRNFDNEYYPDGSESEIEIVNDGYESEDRETKITALLKKNDEMVELVYVF